MDILKIWLLCIGAVVAYGIAHDQVTARLCVEYFTVYHQPLIASTDPTMVGIAWGVAATWWMGAILGLPIAVFARMGDAPRLCARDLVVPLAVLMLLMAVCAWLGGQVGFRLDHAVPLGIPADHARTFRAVLQAHRVSYLCGFIGAIGLCVWIAARRGMAQHTEDDLPGQIRFPAQAQRSQARHPALPVEQGGRPI